ncbi:MAG: sulfotransferase, partial [Deltaproteobacteria bacterium]
MKNDIVITGMFRSGTTLLSTMLNAHPDICSSSDSFQPILKEFRNEIARSLSYEIDPNTPFDDYYFDSKKISLMKKIGESDLHMSSERVDLKSLRQAIAKYASGYSPKIIPLSHEISGGTFSELFESVLKLVKEAYGD